MFLPEMNVLFFLIDIIDEDDILVAHLLAVEES
jgi:hypothetical protein